jgi:hypothetical protein
MGIETEKDEALESRLVVVGSKVPPEFKGTLKEMAAAGEKKTTVSQTVYRLLKTHPEVVAEVARKKQSAV